MLSKLFSFSGLSECNLAILVTIAIGLCIIYPPLWAGLPHIVGLVGFFWMWKTNKERPKFPKLSILVPIALFLALIFISALWSMTPEASLKRAWKVTGVMVAMLPLLSVMTHFSVKAHEILKTYLPWAVVAGAGYLVIELAFNFPISHLIRQDTQELFAWQFNKHVVALFLMSPLACYYLLSDKKFILLGVLSSFIVLIFFLTESQAAQLSMIVMVLAYLGYRVMGRFFMGLSFLGVMAFIIAMPWLANYSYYQIAPKLVTEEAIQQASVLQRMEIWHFVSDKIFQSPWLGHGMDVTRSITFNAPLKYYPYSSVLHPHNMALQIWIEFGALGVLVILGLIGYLFRSLYLMQTEERGLPLMVFLGCMTVLMISWSIWASWLVGLLLFLFVLCCFYTRPQINN